MVVEKNDILIPGIQLYEPESLSRDIIPYSNLYKNYSSTSFSIIALIFPEILAFNHGIYTHESNPPIYRAFLSPVLIFVISPHHNI